MHWVGLSNKPGARFIGFARSSQVGINEKNNYMARYQNKTSQIMVRILFTLRPLFFLLKSTTFDRLTTIFKNSD